MGLRRKPQQPAPDVNPAWRFLQRHNVPGHGMLRTFFANVEKEVADIPDANELQETMQESLGSLGEVLSPVSLLSSSTGAAVKSAAKSNVGTFVRLALEASLYCGAFHLVKEDVKKLTRDRQRLGPAVAFVCDNMLPTGLYGPALGFVIRVTL